MLYLLMQYRITLQGVIFQTGHATHLIISFFNVIFCSKNKLFLHNSFFAIVGIFLQSSQLGWLKFVQKNFSGESEKDLRTSNRNPAGFLEEFSLYWYLLGKSQTVLVKKEASQTSVSNSNSRTVLMIMHCKVFSPALLCFRILLPTSCRSEFFLVGRRIRVLIS